MSSQRSYKKSISELKVGLKFYEIVKALKQLDPKARRDFIEDLQAATSPDYVKTVREARAEYKTGKVFTHKQVFKKITKKRNRNI